MPESEKDTYSRLKGSGYYLAQHIYEKEPRFQLADIVKKYGWKLFNYIHGHKKLEFIFYLERMYASYELQPPKDLLEVLREQNTVRFKEMALAFMMGFISTQKSKDQKGGSHEQ